MSNEPTLVVLGASGDLAARLLFPALLSLEFRERLEDLKIIGYARQEWTTDQFHENLRAAVDMSGVDVDKKYFDRFIDRIEFHGGDISVSALKGLKAALDGPAIFYLALPPGVFADAAETISGDRRPAIPLSSGLKAANRTSCRAEGFLQKRQGAG